MTAPTAPGPARSAIPFAEFIALIALLMSLTALSIDIMLPALPAMGEGLGVDDVNFRQTVLTAYLVGFGIGQVFYGPLADRFGRKPPLIAGLMLSAAASLYCALAPSFDHLLAARLVQGFGLAAPRVVAIAVVRDCFVGREMARVMSLVMTVFIMMPIVAPSVGGLIVRLGDWPWIFIFILAIALTAMIWAGLRLAETRAPEDRLPLSVRGIARAFAAAAGNRQTLGYAVAVGLILSCLLGYIASAQQIFVDLYGLGDLFPLVFGSVALAMAAATFTNSRLVGRYGMRVVGHAAGCGFVAVAIVFVSLAWATSPPLIVFFCVMWASTFFFGLMMPNFNAMAMEPQGHIAGTASSFLGFFTTIVGSLLGWTVGQAFDGTLLPLAAGFAVFSAAALGVVWLTEGGRLFHPRHG